MIRNTNILLAPYGERMPAGLERGCLLNIILCLINYTGTKGITSCLMHIIYRELAENILPMGIDRMEGRNTFLSKILCGESKGDVPQNLGLSFGEQTF